MTGRQPPPIQRGEASYTIHLERRVAELESELEHTHGLLHAASSDALKLRAENEELSRLLQEARDLLYEVGTRLKPLLPYVEGLYYKGLHDNEEAKPREK